MNQPKSHSAYLRSYKRNALLIFFIWPLAGLYLSLKNYRNDWSRNIFWLFCMFFGYTFIIAGEGGADSDRYAREFIYYAHSHMNLSQLLVSFYSESSSYVDIASSIIAYLVSRFTDKPAILFSVYGLIFGYFFSGNLWMVFNFMKEKVSGFALFYVVVFTLIIPIWYINGFRMWTASQIFLFGTLSFLLHDDKKYLFWSGISVLFHYTFLFPWISLIIYIIFKNRLNIYMVLFIISIFIEGLNLESVQSSLSFLPNVFQNRVSGYTNMDYAERIAMEETNVNWYISFSLIAIKLVTYILTLFIYFFHRKILAKRKELMNLFCFSVLFYFFANVASHVPSGGRFITVANAFMFAFFPIFMATFPGIRGSLFVYFISVPFLSLFILVSIRTGMDFYGIMTIIGNPVTAAFYTDPIPFIMEIKNLLL